MNIHVIGSESQQKEVVEKFGSSQQYHFANDVRAAIEKYANSDVVFDFVSAGDPAQLEFYEGMQPVVFFDTTLVPLSKLNLHGDSKSFGLCGLPTLINRPVMEVTVRNERDRGDLTGICKALNSDFHIVADRVGMITPRIICMIINEAFSTVEDGTATREDIDLAMKLGTNYPYGPFEWCRRIGPESVVRLLKAVYHDTGDERYKVCGLLTTEASRSEKKV